MKKAIYYTLGAVAVLVTTFSLPEATNHTPNGETSMSMAELFFGASELMFLALILISVLNKDFDK